MGQEEQRIRPLCNAFTSQVEGILVAITKLHWLRVRLQRFLGPQTPRRGVLPTYTGELLEGATARVPVLTPNPAQALCNHHKLSSQTCIDGVQGSRGQGGSTLFPSGRPVSLHRAPTKCQATIQALSGASAQRDKTTPLGRQAVDTKTHMAND